MSIATKSISDAATKWARRAAVAGEDYRSGVQGAGTRWESGSKASNENYKQGVTAAIGRDAYTKGITAAGGAKYESKALSKGPSRFAEGVGLSLGDYTTGFAPFLQAIAGLTLPPRGPSGDPRNYARSQAIGTALAALKRR